MVIKKGEPLKMLKEVIHGKNSVKTENQVNPIHNNIP